MKKTTLFTALLVLVFQLISCSKKKQDIVKKTVLNTVEKTTPKTVHIKQQLFQENVLKLQADTTQIHFNYKNKDSILAFYNSRNNKPAWTSIKNRTQLYNAIKNSYQEGLQPKEYQIKALEKIQNHPFGKANNIAIDLLLTDIYLSYAYHLANGKIDYKTLHHDWKLPKNKFKYNAILNEGINNTTLSKSLEKFKPKHPIYQQLKNTLPKYKALINTDSLRTIITHGNKIRPHKSDTRILQIRKRLQELGITTDTINSNSIISDSLLQKDLKLFQKNKNLATDAVVGKGTITELNKSYQDNYNSILANLERWKWYPRNFGEDHILVNIPNYQLQYNTKKDTTHYTVVVGKTKRKTPVFNADIKYLVFNPKWHVPPTIKNEDIIPAAIKNPSSITRKRITIYNKEGKRMHPDSIQWNSTAPATYHYVQSAGRNNALGLVKIIFPNKYAVFLHDTNHRNLFVKNYRARSSGCVRVENPFKLAAEILHWTPKKVDSIIKKRNTKRIYIQQKTTVYMLYWNVLFNTEDDLPKFIHDVYDFDKKLIEKLTQ